ncbi:hypothetical protein SynBIOSE41_03125 [Synechococcus sp. BIOS-E4-1]|nr:hypothetical protein SynBIOSE41_03125 [Synechococcus sp. BIOS-E4-1]
MTSAIKDFGRPEEHQTTKLIFYAVVSALIAPCMVGIGLSKKLSRWPKAEAPFKL